MWDFFSSWRYRRRHMEEERAGKGSWSQRLHVGGFPGRGLQLWGTHTGAGTLPKGLQPVDDPGWSQKWVRRKEQGKKRGKKKRVTAKHWSPALPIASRKGQTGTECKVQWRQGDGERQCWWGRCWSEAEPGEQGEKGLPSVFNYLSLCFPTLKSINKSLC